MLIRTGILSCFVLIGCHPGTPEERGIEVSDVYKVYNQDKAMFTAQYLIEDEFDVELGDIIQSTIVYWTDTKCPYTDDIAVIYNGRCTPGRMWSCKEMYVAMYNDDRTCGSSLIHEFGHCLHGKIFSVKDDDHSHEAFWSIISEAQDVSCSREW